MEAALKAASFTPRVFDLLEKIEYRRIQSSEDLEEVGRIRARAYKAANILPVTSTMIIDELDFDSHAYVYGIYYEERLISTVRLHHVTPDHRVSSSAKVFPEIVHEFLDAGMTLIDPTRLAADIDAIQELPGINFLTMRIVTMASEYFDVDRCLSLVKPQHAAFYKKMVEFRTIVPPTFETGNYTIPLTLLSSDLRDARPRIYQRFPFLRAHSYEMRMLFGDLNELPFTPLTILPTARFAARLSTAA